MMEGEYVFEVGQERMRLRPGDSLLAPRRVPHVWAYVGETPGKILIGFQPAGKMETFFQEAAKISDFAADEKLYTARARWKLLAHRSRWCRGPMPSLTRFDVLSLNGTYKAS